MVESAKPEQLHARPRSETLVWAREGNGYVVRFLADSWHTEEVYCDVHLDVGDAHCTFSAQPTELDEDLDLLTEQSGWSQFYRGWEGWLGWDMNSAFVAYRTYSDDINAVFWSRFDADNLGEPPDEGQGDGDDATLWLLTAICRSIFSHGSDDSGHGWTDG